MKKNISIPISVFYILTLLYPVIIGIVSSDFSWPFLFLLYILVIWFFLSVIFLFVSAIYLFFNKKNHEKKTIIIKNIKKYFWLLIINFGLLITAQLIFHPFTTISGYKLCNPCQPIIYSK